MPNKMFLMVGIKCSKSNVTVMDNKEQGILKLHSLKMVLAFASRVVQDSRQIATFLKLLIMLPRAPNPFPVHFRI